MRHIIVDGTNHLVRLAIYSEPLFNSELIDISAVRLFLKFIHELVRFESPNKLHIVFDVGKDIKKQKISETYKKNRIQVSNTKEATTSITDEIVDKIRASRNILIKIMKRLINTHVYPILAVEGDTIIAYVAKLIQKANKDDEILIVSNDSDFYQLLDKSGKIKILRYSRSNYRKIDFETFIKDEGYIAQDVSHNFIEHLETLEDTLPYLRAPIGDATDNIIGIRGIGIGFIRKLTQIMSKHHKYAFNDFDDFAKFINSLNPSEFDRRYQKQLKLLKENLEHVRMNFKLISFKYAISELDNSSVFDVMSELKRDTENLQLSDFYSALNEYELNSDENDMLMYTELYMNLTKSSDVSDGIGEGFRAWERIIERLEKLAKNHE